MQRAGWLDLITLPLRTAVLLLLTFSAYYLGYGSPQEEWRKESPETGVVARYTRDGRPWRIFYDRDADRRWDQWIDERGGPPYIVSIDDNGDGQPDRDVDEFGTAMTAWRASQLRATKTFWEFVTNPRQLQYVALAILMYTLFEFAIRSLTKNDANRH
jgi:hypothetical protein